MLINSHTKSQDRSLVLVVVVVVEEVAIVVLVEVVVAVVVSPKMEQQTHPQSQTNDS